MGEEPCCLRRPADDSAANQHQLPAKLDRWSRNCRVRSCPCMPPSLSYVDNCIQKRFRRINDMQVSIELTWPVDVATIWGWGCCPESMSPAQSIRDEAALRDSSRATSLTAGLSASQDQPSQLGSGSDLGATSENSLAIGNNARNVHVACVRRSTDS